MKKILAAVLAAAMALSMSAVAFAKNFDNTGSVGLEGEVESGGGSITLSQRLGKSKTYVVNPGFISGRLAAPGEVNLNYSVLYDLIDAGDAVKIDVSVLSNKRALSNTPSVTKGKDSAGNPASVLTVGFNDTWGTGKQTVEMRIRITAKKALTINDFNGSGDTAVVLEKGDTVTLQSFSVEAEYGDIAEYGKTITMTKNEMDLRDIVANGESLYNGADDNDKVVIYFKDKRDRDIAAYEVKVSPNQKAVNLGYNTDAIDEVTEAYPDVEFEFIKFEAMASGANKFTNNGTLYFNPIGGSDTVVYEVVDGELVPADSNYDSDDKVVYVKNIRALTQYVVASEALPEDEEPEEPSESTPSDVDAPVTNPGTGAL